MDLDDRRCDRCKLRFLSCNGSKPCNLCIRYGKQTKQTPLNLCSYTTVQNTPDCLMLASETESSIDSPLQITIPIELEQALCSANGTVESHLLNTTFIHWIEIVVESDCTLNYPQYKKMISQSYHNALCCLALPFSTHPRLFQNSNVRSVEELVNVSKRFPRVTYNQLLKQRHDNISIHCDNIRALASFSSFDFILGLDSFVSFNDAWDLMNVHFGESQIKKFPKKQNSLYTSVDDLVNLLSPAKQSKYGSKTLKLQEQLDCYSIWVYFYDLCTIGSLAVFDSFYFDDAEFENIYFDIPTTVPKCNRHFLPELAKYTIWEGTIWAPLFDELREASFHWKERVGNSGLELRNSILYCNLLRKIVRYSRLSKYDEESREANRDFHQTVLYFIKGHEGEETFFDSLTYFLYKSTTVPENDIRLLRMSRDPIGHVSYALLMLSYLHFPLVQSNSDQLFPVYIGGPELFSSRDILFATTNALGYTIKRLSTPMLPSESMFGYYPYPKEELEICMESRIDAAIPAPTVASLEVMAVTYSIVSTSLSAFQYPGTDQTQYMALKFQVEDCLYPLLNSLSRFYPMAVSLTEKIRLLLDKNM